MKIDTRERALLGGLCEVEVHFTSDDGKEDVRPPMSTVVEDKGMPVIVRRAAYMKLRAELPADETEVRALLTRAIYEP